MTPQRRFMEIAEIAIALAPGYRQWKTDVGMFTADGYPTGGDGNGRSSGVADPTFQAVQARRPNADTVREIELDIVECYLAMRRIANRMAAVAPSAVDVKAISRLHRCADPTCDRLAVRRQNQPGGAICEVHYKEYLQQGKVTAQHE